MNRNIFTRLCYVLFFVLIALLYRFFVSYFLILLMAALICFPIFSIGVLCYVRGKLEFRLETPASIERGNPVGLTLHIKNSSPFPIARAMITLTFENLFYPQPDDYTFICGIPAGKESTITLSINCEYSGAHSFTLKEVRIWDYTAMADVSVEAEAGASTVALPRVIEEEFTTEAIGGAGLTELVEQETKGNDSSTVIDTRDYQPGDKLQRIHWKLSTKLDKLLVKEYGSISSNDVFVLVELYRNLDGAPDLEAESLSHKRFDRIFDVYITLMEHLISEKRPFFLNWYSPALGELKSEEITSREAGTAALQQLFYETLSSHPDDGISMCKKTMDEYGDIIYICPAYEECENNLAGLDADTLFSCTENDRVLANAFHVKL